jgi:putative CocE/NonD family hydrolase
METTDPDDPGLGAVVRTLAQAQLVHPPPLPAEPQLADRALIELAAEANAGALSTLVQLRSTAHPADPARAAVLEMSDELYARARQDEARGGTFEAALATTFRAAYAQFDDLTAAHASSFLPTAAQRANARGDLQRTLARLRGKPLSGADAGELIERYARYAIDRALVPLLPALQAQDDARRYDIDNDAQIRTRDGATVSAVVVRPKRAGGRQPAVLYFSIYTDNVDREAVISAAHGYTGVAAFSRGKRSSPGKAEPYEHDVDDTYDTIEWITEQAWSDGRVAMYGGSYCGYTQWAATKHLHRALKTIVPYVAAIPGQGLPMENNIFLNANYGWPFFVTDGPFDDNAVYGDAQRWRALPGRWFESGRPYREIDQVDGTPNPWLQRWLQHPAYDAYWQSKVPYGADFANLNIPVLTVTGYYDDGQISALRYFREHTRANAHAQHYVVIGPYDHRGAQRHPPAELRGYALDPVAVIDTQALTFQWFDHVLRGAAMPALIQDRVNYEVMGANEWRHAPSLEQLDREALTLYLADHRLVTTKPAKPVSVEETVDLGDRKTQTNVYYPDPIVQDELDVAGGAVFESEPLDRPISVDGILRGELHVTINKKDLDVGVELYEHRKDGTYFALAYYLGRASYARDMTRRQLLKPGREETIPFERSRMVSKQLAAGSRLVVVVNVNKNAFAEVNMGTGRSVEDESAKDAGEPLKVQWWSDSFVKLQVRR